MYRKFLLNEYHDYFCLFLLSCIGYKVCLHVHGVFPYLYIPCDGSAPPDKMGHHIVMALDRAVNILQGQGNSSSHYVFKTVILSGVPRQTGEKNIVHSFPVPL
jgi:DNA polymerase zeta